MALPEWRTKEDRIQEQGKLRRARPQYVRLAVCWNKGNGYSSSALIDAGLFEFIHLHGVEKNIRIEIRPNIRKGKDKHPDIEIYAVISEKG